MSLTPVCLAPFMVAFFDVVSCKNSFFFCVFPSLSFKGFEYTQLVPWREAKSTVLFKYNKLVIYAQSQYDEVVGAGMVHVSDIAQYVQTARPKGGVLADEMGLGKTMECKGSHLLSDTCFISFISICNLLLI